MVLLLHGFPGSTFDWARLIDGLHADVRVIGFDLPGAGLSAKPVTGPYSIFTYADASEELLARRHVGRAVLVAHDIGTTVAAELLHRGNAGALGFDAAGCLLTNGSIFIDQAQLTDGQQFLLALPDDVLAEPLPDELLAGGLAVSFPPDRPDPDTLAAMVWLIRREHGDQLLPRIIRYIEERWAHQSRWSAAFAGYDGSFRAGWGELDPIAVVAMMDTLATLRDAAGRGTAITRWPDVGHWPCVETPERVVALVRDLLDDLG